MLDGPEDVQARVASSTSSAATWEFDVDGDGTYGDSLSDGRWTARLDRVKVTNDAGGTLQGTDDTPDDGSLDVVSVHRLFGDSDGDGDVDGTDYYNFRTAYYNSVSGDPFASYFDHDGNGEIGRDDYHAFFDRYGDVV